MAVEIDGVRYSWTQPVCTQCWVAENAVPDDNGGALIRVPTRLLDAEREWPDLLERCCKCGRATTSQIFIRIDPREAPFPTPEDDD